jgi:hypothetical protein
MAAFTFAIVAWSIADMPWAFLACDAIFPINSVSELARASKPHDIPISLHANFFAIFTPITYLIEHIYSFLCNRRTTGYSGLAFVYAKALRAHTVAFYASPASTE